VSSRNSNWKEFTIISLEVEAGAVIKYGTKVLLVAEGSLATESLIICQVEMSRRQEKSVLMYSQNRPVSHLHKVAFQMHKLGKVYLSTSIGNDNDNENEISLLPSSMDGNSEKIHDSASWTIAGTEEIMYYFVESDTITRETGLVAPIPIVYSIRIHNSKLVDFQGSQFTRSLTIWFGDIPAKTLYHSEELLSCEPPAVSELSGVLLGQYPNFAVRIEVPPIVH